MPFIYKITDSNRLNDINHEISNLEVAVRDGKNRVKTQKNIYKNYLRMLWTLRHKKEWTHEELMLCLYSVTMYTASDILGEDYPEHSVDNDLSVMQEQLHRYVKATKRYLAEVKGYLEENKRALAMKLQQRARIEAEQNENNIEINQTKLHNTLLRHNKVNQIESYTVGDIFHVVIHLGHTIMLPADENSNARAVPLKPITMQLCFSPTSVFPIGRELYGQMYESYSGDYHVHPHWLLSGPCLGDFQVSINDALIQGDIISAITLYIEFLGYYDPIDSAGRYWECWENEPDDYREFVRPPSNHKHYLHTRK